MTDIPRSARLYFRPTAFVDAPFDLDDQVLRLAGGMLWFSAFDIIAVDGGERLPPRLICVDALDAFVDTLSEDQAEQARLTIARITEPRASLQLGERVLRLDEPRVVGILNVTPDSFSDGGRHSDDPEAAADAGFAMSSAGAALIDVGGESTRPGAKDVWEGDELTRVAPVIERLAASGVAVSIDTRKAAVMEAALSAGAAIVNDVSALRFDDRAPAVVAQADCPVIIMHHAGKGHELHADPDYRDPLIEVYDWLEDRIGALGDAGVGRERIIVDPGIGFGKSLQHNLALINGLGLFHGLGCPIMLGASRKRLIGALSNAAPVEERLGGSISLTVLAAAQGVQLLRVHDVSESVQALHIWRGLRDAALIPPG
ncbi:MAG: dihydropteroate synthase [Pseudomonadota bacterium]